MNEVLIFDIKSLIDKETGVHETYSFEGPVDFEDFIEKFHQVGKKLDFLINTQLELKFIIQVINLNMKNFHQIK